MQVIVDNKERKTGLFDKIIQFWSLSYHNGIQSMLFFILLIKRNESNQSNYFFIDSTLLTYMFFVFCFNYINNWKNFHSSEESFNQIQWKFVTYNPFFEHDSLQCYMKWDVFQHLIKKNWLHGMCFMNTIDYFRERNDSAI